MNIGRKFFSAIDFITLVPVLVLVALGLVTLFSLDHESFNSQVIFTIFSLAAFVLAINTNPNALKHYDVPIYIVSIVLFAIVLILGIESRGSVRWIEIFGVRIQFSEVLKPFLAVSLASYLSEVKSTSLKNFLQILLLLAPIFILIFLQPDLGNALIYAGVAVLALLIYGFPLKYFVSGFLLWLVSFPLLWFFLHDYQKQRLLTFINPSQDPLGTSYNAIQSVIAVGSGMIMGKGLGQGTQSTLRFLPEHHTDFIFATISENLGFIGSGIVILAFCFLLYRIYVTFVTSEDAFSKNYALIVFLLIFIHFFMNVGMNLGIVPIVGVTLPFVSSGGSSLLSNFIMIGLLFAVGKSSSRKKVLEIG
ncbi:MAG: hypothetical protein A2186_04040 [Candidatus Levybacteria bacterium RIFOXYA1_FULL_41_10]|nr:MAG: Rod shape-determining protein RodA [Candidatus Levybacteria bacterium GW2011_GWC1_40_19]KKR73332.1 MAG: Rod shape-determining protein RodA [Candidatus Levybacteria bacterium GW2011_GWC2_40_7]KKR94017.1 MAG: Rod shape-determining protein RodA [Candidatus Levybacteria bacterium GW2011_GWA2_41_15]KKS01576.1 MAG: Rod shape-determining protein RodA [Candidatus Levybacteria bacterium GW2011_GWB1_41_21]OGH21018.1 MAG: hypothetical protein A2695_02430 [Candidatus Levybacteria bacterium RIFCSPHI